METAIVKIESRNFSGENINSVDARELWAALEVKTEFKDWINRRIDGYGFVEGKDFCSYLSESTGGRPCKEYALTIDMGKEVAMLEGNERGKEVRRYFIEAEKKSRTIPAIPRTYLEALEAAARIERERLLLETKAKELEVVVEAQAGEIAGLEPDAEYTRRMVKDDTLITLTQVAAKLEISAVKLNRWLVFAGVLRKMERGLVPMAKYLAQGLFKIQKVEAGGHYYDQVLVTLRGEKWIIERWNEHKAAMASASVQLQLFDLK